MHLPKQSRVDLFQKKMSSEDYATLVRQHHEYIKTGTMTPCMRTKASNQHSVETVDHKSDERRFTLDQSEIIKCHDQTVLNDNDTFLLDRL